MHPKETSGASLMGNIIGIVLFISIMVGLSYSGIKRGSKLRKEIETMSIFINKEVIISNDTLTITSYNYETKEFILHNGAKITKEFMETVKFVPPNLKHKTF